MKLVKKYTDNDVLRKSMSDLAKKTFGLDFEPFYEAGYWKENYNSYSIIDENKVVSNLNFTELELEKEGERFSAIQIGAVMTADSYRGQGLSRQLMEELLKDYWNTEVIFLFANESVLDFYPKFGFKPVDHYHFKMSWDGSSKGEFEKVDFASEKINIEEIIKSRKKNSVDDYLYGDDFIKLFYLMYVYSDNIAKVKNSYVVYTKEDSKIIIHDVYTTEDDMLSVVKPLLKDITEVYFEFEPRGIEVQSHLVKDSGLFVLTDHIKLLKPWSYPQTSVT